MVTLNVLCAGSFQPHICYVRSFNQLFNTLRRSEPAGGVFVLPYENLRSESRYDCHGCNLAHVVAVARQSKIALLAPINRSRVFLYAPEVVYQIEISLNVSRLNICVE